MKIVMKNNIISGLQGEKFNQILKRKKMTPLKKALTVPCQ